VICLAVRQAAVPTLGWVVHVCGNGGTSKHTLRACLRGSAMCSGPFHPVHVSGDMVSARGSRVELKI